VEVPSMLALLAASSKVASRIDLEDGLVVCHHSVILSNNTDQQSFYLRRMVLINGFPTCFKIIFQFLSCLQTIKKI
jgi:hypothetical protein